MANSVMFPEQSSSPADDAVENQQVDMNAFIEVDDPEANVNEQIPPPKKGVYPIKWALDDAVGVVCSADKNGKPFLYFNRKGRITAEGNDDGFPVSGYINSLKDRTGNSKVHYFLHTLGETVPAKVSMQELKDTVERVLALEPTGLGLCDWHAQYPDGTLNKKGKANYKTLKMGMEHFPWAKDESGVKVYNHILENPKDGSKVVARLEVMQDLTQAEAAKLS